MTGYVYVFSDDKDAADWVAQKVAFSNGTTPGRFMKSYVATGDEKLLCAQLEMCSKLAVHSVIKSLKKHTEKK